MLTIPSGSPRHPDSQALRRCDYAFPGVLNIQLRQGQCRIRACPGAACCEMCLRYSRYPPPPPAIVADQAQSDFIPATESTPAVTSRTTNNYQGIVNWFPPGVSGWKPIGSFGMKCAKMFQVKHFAISPENYHTYLDFNRCNHFMLHNVIIPCRQEQQSQKNSAVKTL
jgi:hypothetical protein